MFSFIPYVFGSFSNDYELNSGNIWKKDFGFDAIVGFSTSLNPDLTYNPDFSKVEGDAQVTNTDRFELLYPEKSQFFLKHRPFCWFWGLQCHSIFFTKNRFGCTSYGWSPVKW